MRSLPEFLAIAVLVTITPGPGTATVLRAAARDGRAAARGTILGNSAGVLTWGVLSAVGMSSALAMAATVVALDIVWFSALAYAVDKARTLLRPRVQRVMEQVTGAVMIGLGIRLALESR